MRPWQTWLAFAGSLALLLAVMGWVSLTVIRLDEASAEARRFTAFEEDVRLALWRMDSNVSPLIGRESARPYYHYSRFHSAEKAADGWPVPLEAHGIAIPSPLQRHTPRHVVLHFEFSLDGRLTSPQTADHAANTGRVGSVEDLGRLVNRATLDRLLPAAPLLLAAAPPQKVKQRKVQRKLRNPEAQQALNVVEFQARQATFHNANEPMQQAVTLQAPDAMDAGTEANVAKLHPLWIAEDMLLLARRVAVDGGSLIQGCWLDWPGLRAELQTSVADLLPGARLEPVRQDTQGEAVGRRLASLPVVLHPGDPPATPDSALSPIQLSLLVAWACLLLAGAAVSVLLRGAVALSERRGAFVSAVTHELRTPLTTLRMYAEMLAGGMVQGEDRQREYLSTLQAQSERLAHLVENVLAYSRLERGRSGGPVERVAVASLLDRVRGPLEEQARQAGMTLSVDGAESADVTAVQVDLSAVERILFNLVDNAGKYGNNEQHATISLRAERNGNALCLRVRDHGPGVPRAVRARLFRPFEKSAVEAAHTAPGVGLGLALSRRLARAMGGDLRLDETVIDGAAFVLSLPIVS